MAEYQDRNQNDANGADQARQGWQSGGAGQNGGQGADGWNNGTGWNQGQGWNNGTGWNQSQGWNNGTGWNNSQSGQGWENGSNGWSGGNGYGNGSGRRLTRSSSNRMICGVCAGIAEYLNWDPTIVRLIWVGVSILFGAGFLGLIAYFIVAVIMPER